MEELDEDDERLLNLGGVYSEPGEYAPLSSPVEAFDDKSRDSAFDLLDMEGLASMMMSLLPHRHKNRSLLITSMRDGAKLPIPKI